jgi:hypothetical protein
VLVGAHDLLLSLRDDFPAVGNLHHVDVSRVEQALGVIAEPEDRRSLDGLVGAHALEHREAVVQGVGKDVSRRGTPRHELAVVPDVSVAIGHRHERFSGEPSKIVILAETGATPTRAGKGRKLEELQGVVSVISATPKQPCG